MCVEARKERGRLLANTLLFNRDSLIVGSKFLFDLSGFLGR